MTPVPRPAGSDPACGYVDMIPGQVERFEAAQKSQSLFDVGAQDASGAIGEPEGPRMPRAAASATERPSR
jgi:hypothetical protein